MVDSAGTENGIAFADMHVHPALPWVGSAWRRRVQGFHPLFLDGPDAPPLPAARKPTDLSLAPIPPRRLYGAVFYVTYLLRPAAARLRLFQSLAAFRAHGHLILSSADLSPGSPGWDYGSEACFLAVESMRCLRDPGDVRRLWDLGVRSLQPIHFLDTPWGGSSREGILSESRTGLTGLGRELLAEMEALGMILDLAHMSRKNAEDCLDAYKGPVMCSHTGFASLKPSARNVPPDLAREIFRRKGIVGVTCWRHLLGSGTGMAPEGRDLEPSMRLAQASDRCLLKRPGPARAAWTRAYCETAAAFASLAPDAGVAIGSDRGAPIRAPGWFYSPAHLAEMETHLTALGWGSGRIRGFFSGHAADFLNRSLPANGGRILRG